MLTKNRILSILLIVCIIAGMTSFVRPSFAQKEQVTLTALLDNLAHPGRWDTLIQPALQQLRERHPDIDIQISYQESPYNQTRDKILAALTNQTPVDLVSVDQIWLGEFAEKGLLTDLTNRTEKWGRSSDWYQANWDGGSFNKKIYGIWAWTDVRGMWYWKDLLKKADVDPESLSSWSGYLNGAKKLQEKLGNGTEGMYLVAASHSPDLWYPYLWMLGGQILEYDDGHPTKGRYWFPAYNSSQGVRALEFLKEQVKVGIKPQVDALHQAQDFVDRKFAVSIDGSWVPGEFPPEKRNQLENLVGFLPAFPISTHETNQSATMMGGWELSIPVSSKHKDLAWELITIMLEPKTLAPWLLKFGYLPTQSVTGEANTNGSQSLSFPYYDKMVSMIPLGHVRPSIAEYPMIASHISQAIKEVLTEGKDARQALQDAASKSAKDLGW